MKNVKKMFTIVLCFSLIFGTITVAKASGSVGAGEKPVVITEDDFTVTFDGELVAQQIAEAALNQSSSEDEASPMAYPQPVYASVRKVTSYPLVRCVETGERSYWSSVYNVQRWSAQNSSSVVAYLTTAETTRLNNLALSKSVAQNDGLTYELCGWYVVSDLEFNTQGYTALYAKWSHSNNCFEGTAEQQENIPYTNTITIEGSYEIDPNLTTYKYGGWDGGFYYIGDHNKILGLYIASGIGVNSDA